jgi:hypothetical protein
MDYPNEIKRIDQFSPEIIVSPSVVNPDLTQKSYHLAGRIAEHFGKADRPARLQTEISRETGRRSGISPEPRARRERNPGREQDR